MITPDSSTPPEYESLHESLVHAGVVLALPELHGGICGALCAGGTDAAQRWLDDAVLDDQSGAHDPARLAPVRTALGELADASFATLEGASLTFQPLLPNDDAPLDEQVQALAAWCQGFLAALGENAPGVVEPRASGTRGPSATRGGGERAAAKSGADAGRDAGADSGGAPAELAEILADFAEISRAGLTDDDAVDRDQADFALAELKEYMRMSAQIVFEELRPLRAARASVH
ncbi:MAG TPA: UPF0149 family protein [Gammaproteobacteria bacterium]|nr:UPF0149 family protein [Gammaproteobacteria bacterium]